MSESVASEMPDVGMQEGVPNETYQAWGAVSQTFLSDMRRSPAHARHKADNPAAPTPSQNLGTAAHGAILEPEAVDSRYVIAGQCQGKTQQGKQCSYGGVICRDGTWFCRRHDPGEDAGDLDTRQVLDQDTYEAVIGARDAVLAHGACRQLLQQPGRNEVSLVADDTSATEPAVRCKARPDRLIESVGLIVDVKTTRDASRHAFERDLFNFAYHMQAAHYIQLAHLLGIDVKHFALVVVETTSPYACAAYRIADDVVEAGKNERHYLLQRYRECERTGHWPGYPDEIQDIDLPRWAWQRLQTQED